MPFPFFILMGHHPKGSIISIYGPMIYTTPCVMFLMQANPLQGPLEGLGHESLDFFVPNPCNGPCNGFACIKNITYGAVKIIGP